MIALILASHLVAQTYHWDYQPAPGPLNNPLKGWVPYVGEGSQIRQPYSTVYFNVTWRDLEPQPGVFKFEEWEKKFWDLPAAKGKHVVFRVNMDYPTQKPGVPQWLLDQGLKMTPYTDHGGGLSPDYSDPRLQKALLDFIRALGKRYDGNPRVAFIQVGLLGFWGEWHTWPRTELFASASFQRQVLDAMTAAFSHTKLLARNPSTEAGKYPSLGFHDDMIPQDTLGSEDWKFLQSILANHLKDNWKQEPRGGEMVPFAAKQYMISEFATTRQAVQDVHFTWIGPYCPAIESIDGDDYANNCKQLVREMGYQFTLKQVDLDLSQGTCHFHLTGENTGVAPFYYPWKVRLAFIDASGHVDTQVDTSIDITRWQPGAFEAKGTIPLAVKPGKYRLALGVIDPFFNRPNVEFANSFSKVEGWQILGQVQIGGSKSNEQKSND